jgi:transforming growth factor-beta-induced protein
MNTSRTKKVTRRTALQTLAAGALLLGTSAMPAIASAQPAIARPTGQEGKTIVQIASETSVFSTLVAAVKAAGLVNTLSGHGPFTVFAPTNDAFAKLPPDLLASLLKPENKVTLTKILTYHVVAGSVKAADVVKLTEATTVEGEKVNIKVDGGNVMVNDAKVTQTDIVASNGVIHVIDTVIVPPSVLAAMSQPKAMDIVDTAVAAGSFKWLTMLAGIAGLADTLKHGNLTVFAPTDAAFTKLPSEVLASLLMPENRQKLIDILTYHVVPGSVKAAQVVKLSSAKTVEGDTVAIKVADGKVYVNDAQVVQTDIMASNGVIHVIDSVLLPPTKPANIVDTAVAAGSFKWLTMLAGIAGLGDTLKNGNLTVFAPTDEAFTKLPAGTLDALLKPENRQMLVSILTYHVVPGSVKAAQVVNLTSAKTVQGSSVAIKVVDGKVYINDAQVVLTDIMASNGVIHVIDSVLLPPAK